MAKNSTPPETVTRDSHGAASEAFVPSVHAADMRELSCFLELMIDQISFTLQESEGSVNVLTASITMMAANVSKIEQHLPDLTKASKRRYLDSTEVEQADVDDVLSVSEMMRTFCAQVENEMLKAVTAFQFYDRLSQRITHIQENLQAISEVTRAQDKQHPVLWRRLHERMRSVYTLEQEQRLYRALLQRLSAEGRNTDVMSSSVKEHDNAASRSANEKTSSYGDIELF